MSVVYRGIDWEVIVVDDASPDGTQKVCRELMGIFNTKDKDYIVRVPQCMLGLSTASLGTKEEYSQNVCL